MLIAAIVIAACNCSCSIQKPSTKVDVVPCEGTWEAPEAVEELGGASVKQALLDADGNRYEMYPTFDDGDAAIGAAAKKAPRVLRLLGKTYRLQPLSDSNWRRYEEALLDMNGRRDRPSWYGEGSEEYRVLRTFFDIYEGYERNEEIVRLAKEQGIDAVKDMLPATDD